MKPVKPSATRSQFLKGNNLCDSIYVVTSAYTDEDGSITPALITCWQLSLWERIKILFTGKVYVEQLTTKLSPQKLSLSRTEVNLDKIEATDISAWGGAIGAEALSDRASSQKPYLY